MTVLRWVALALAGLVIAAGAAYAASRLATQPIGLSSEPIRAGDDLAPRATPRPRRTPTPTPTATSTATPAPTADDGSGRGRGRGRGRGGDDDD